MKGRRSHEESDIARYVLGLELHEQASDIQAQLARDDAAAAKALKWEAYLLDIVDALPKTRPPEGLLTEIQGSLGMLPEASSGLAAEDGTIEAPANAPDPAVLGAGHNGPDATAPLDSDAVRTAAKPAEKSGRKKFNRVQLVSAVAVIVLLVLGLLLWAGMHKDESGIASENVQILNSD